MGYKGVSIGHSLNYVVIRMWNNLPCTIRESASLTIKINIPKMLLIGVLFVYRVYHAHFMYCLYVMRYYAILMV